MQVYLSDPDEHYATRWRLHFTKWKFGRKTEHTALDRFEVLRLGPISYVKVYER